jgi:hypothetical protein
MKKIVVGIVLISIVFLLSACSDNVVKDIEDDVSSNGLAKIIINTEEISISDNTVAQVQDVNEDKNITHIGTRIEYPGKTAYFIQSVEIDQAIDSGIITFDIPATEDASIYVVAVNYDDSIAKFYGVKRGINIEIDTVTEIRTNDFDWVKADWKYGEDETQILVRDPFEQVDLRYDQYYFGINGSCSISESDDFTDDGYRIFYEAEGTPYLKHSFFNLPFKSRYLINQVE